MGLRCPVHLATPWLRMQGSGLALLGVLAGGCARAPEPLGELPPPRSAARAELPALALAHAGQGSPARLSDGPAKAVTATLQALEGGQSPMKAAMAGVYVLEDDPRFNAGTGANLRLDGRTIQADAAIMDDAGRFGAVAGVHGYRHPIDIAHAVIDTPHALLAGAGAQAFADTLSLQQADLTSDWARNTLARGFRRLFGGQLWPAFDWRAHWNFERPAPSTLEQALSYAHPNAGRQQGGGTQPRAGDHGEPASDAPAEAQRAHAEATAEVSDTVGMVLRTAQGEYVAALSTGGTTLALRGRVGDVPQLGSGLYADDHGAVAATGKGEAIIKARVAARVYGLLAQGVDPDAAIRRVIRRVAPGAGVGVIAVSDRGFGARATTQMAWAAQEAGESGEVVRADTVVW